MSVFWNQQKEIATLPENYIGLAMAMVFFYLIIGPSKDTSLSLVLLLGLPITAIMFFTGLNEKLKKYFP